MKYLSGTYALNLPCSLETSGDWHYSGIDWNNIKSFDTTKMPLGEYGIEKNKFVPVLNQKLHVANHIRALLDMLVLGNYGTPQGMKNDFIDNPKYTKVIFNKVSELQLLPNWENIDKFMEREYKTEWLNYKGGKHE